jgi:molybdopterin-guanine dinucleotide biosynthesis protein A
MSKTKGGLILLAGGASRRMGRDKSLLDFGGQPLARRIIHRLIVEKEWEPLIVTRPSHPAAEWGWSVAFDQWPGAGPLAGLVTGLHASCHDWNLAVACDMPFVSRELAAALFHAGVNNGADVVIPRFDGQLHPLFACYHRRSRAVGSRLIASGERALQALYTTSKTYVLEEAAFPPSLDPQRALFNMNRPSDYEQAQRWL